MQKRPNELEKRYVPYDLPDEFPVGGGGIGKQRDREILHLHLHNCLEVGYCYSGSGIFVVEDKVFDFKEGDVSIINDKEMHLASSTKGTVSTWSWILLDPARLIGAAVSDPGLLSISELGGSDFSNIVSPKESPEICRSIRSISEEMMVRSPNYQESIRGLVWNLMVQLHRMPGRGGDSGQEGKGISRIAPALQYMARHYNEPLSIDELAELCFLSPTHFRRVFQDAAGIAPLKYLTALRIRIAAGLLRNTDNPILDISLDSGYPTLSSFNRQFKKHMGCSPRQWRRMEKSSVISNR